MVRSTRIANRVVEAAELAAAMGRLAAADSGGTMNDKIKGFAVAAVCAGVMALAGAGQAMAQTVPVEAKPNASATPAATPPPAGAGPVTLSGSLLVDLVQSDQSANTSVRELDKLNLTMNADLEQLFQWKGATGSLSIQNTSGTTPNDDIGTLEGVDNIEAPVRRLRLYEAWIEQAFGDTAALKVGLIDLNTEFYVNPSSGLLLGPQYGIGTEFSATGPGGPSIFPATGLGARLQIKPAKDFYINGGVFNAHVGDPGDRGGVDTSFDEGVIDVAEGGFANDDGKLAVGGWRYSKKQDEQFAAAQSTSSGVYVLAERKLIDGGDTGISLTAFMRAGASDGDTGFSKGALDAGVLIDHPFAARPDSQLSFGVSQVYLGDQFKAASAAAGAPLGSDESHLELTYFDKLTDHFSIQPDVQYVSHTGGDPNAKNALVFILRLAASF